MQLSWKSSLGLFRPVFIVEWGPSSRLWRPQVSFRDPIPVPALAGGLSLTGAHSFSTTRLP